MTDRDFPTIDARVTFLTTKDGGRTVPAFDDRRYRPHIVIGDPNQREAHYDDQGKGADRYLGVVFLGAGVELALGKEHRVRLGLWIPDVDYAEVVSGATFTVREGGRVVGFGEVVGKN